MDVVYFVATSLDGFIADRDGGVDWLLPFQDSGEDYGFEALQKSVDAVILGSRTYEQMLGFEGDPLARLGKPCWVLSARPLRATVRSVRITSTPPGQLIGEMGSRGVRRAWLMGGTRLASSFRAANLITEYDLGVIPVLLGSGVPLFESPGPPARLTLIESKAHPSGVLQVRYRVA